MHTLCPTCPARLHPKAFSRGGAAGFKMDLKTALTFIQSETIMDLTAEEHEEIRARLALIRPQAGAPYNDPRWLH